MKKFLLLTLCTLLMSSYGVLAQTSVAGKVADSTGPIPGVNIVEKGTSNGAVTDFDGNYKIAVQPGATLIFSFVGYENQEIAIGNRTVIDIQMAEDAQQLAEVVVIGYGTQEKKEITSAVVSVGAEDFNQGNIPDPSQLLQGKVAGLSIVKPGGDPNGKFTIRLRGLSSFGANSEPLIVIDGVVGASLENLDPNDIESMDVLKDGGAASIYGTRGSSGVILITTKKGARGSISLDYNTFVNIESVANKPSVLSSDEFLARGGGDNGSNTDWFDEITDTGISHTHNIAVSGGSETTSYRVSFNFRDRESVAKGHDFNRLNTRLNLTQSFLNNKLRFSFNMSSSNQTTREVPRAAFRYTTVYNPTAPIFDESNTASGGYFQQPLFDFYNPVALINQITTEKLTKNILTSYRAEYDILDNLTASLSYSEDRSDETVGTYASKFDAFIGAGSNGLAEKFAEDKSTRLLENTYSYNTTISDNIDIAILGGYSFQEFETSNFKARVQNFLFDINGVDDLDAAITREGGNTEISSFRKKDKIISYYGRVNLNIANSYFINGSLRNEGYSGFGDNNKRATFFALSAGAELTSVFDISGFNSLKVRASYGETGNLPIEPYLSLPRFSNGGIVTLPDGTELATYAPASNPNPDLKWETKKEFDFGVDFSLMDGKLSGSMDYYTRKTEDLLFFSPVPVPPNQFPFTWLNIGEMENSGFELSLNYAAIQSADFSWDPSVNMTFYNSNKLNSLSSGDVQNSEFFTAILGSPGQNDQPIIRVKEGERIGDIYGPTFQGVESDGSYIQSDEFGVIGNGLPDFEFGFNNSMTFKNFDLNFFIRGTFGHSLYNTYRAFYENQDAGSNTWNSVITDKTETITAAPTFSSLYVENASFIRLDNATLGYNVPIKSSSTLTKLRIYFSVQNVFTITDYTGIDPEVRYADTGRQTNTIQALGENELPGTRPNALAPGIERRNTFFTTRSFTFGVNIGL